MGKPSIVRSIWRFVEILIFFVISVVGFNLLVKTTSLNTRSKVKSLSGEPVAPRELTVPRSTHLQRYGLDRLTEGLTLPLDENHRSISNRSTQQAFADFLYHSIHLRSLYSDCPNSNTPAFLSPLHEPLNLFQQNRILLI